MVFEFKVVGLYVCVAVVGLLIASSGLVLVVCVA